MMRSTLVPNQDQVEAFGAKRLGFQVVRAAAALPQTTQAPLFTVGITGTPADAMLGAGQGVRFVSAVILNPGTVDLSCVRRGGLTHKGAVGK